ncbi:MAG: carbohydrate ABC transporter substrate-binding protein, partial [Treponema sp.]|nr:carbohydrate ABC transporter substrate-binding protein [Treponema sp.]
TGIEVQTFDLETGGLTIPARIDIDMTMLKLEPMQQAAGDLGTQYTTTTKVIDDAFHSDVYNPLNDGLLQIGAGTRTPQQVAQDIQRAFDTWKSTRG